MWYCFGGAPNSTGNETTKRDQHLDPRGKQGFCNKCEVSIFFEFLGSNNISISAGMFKNPTKLKTKKNIFVKRKLDYYKLDNQLPKFNRY